MIELKPIPRRSEKQKARINKIIQKRKETYKSSNTQRFWCAFCNNKADLVLLGQFHCGKCALKKYKKG
tara:strand:- start:11867 stop:12070 length:204 start_codon:yes stop_codon:yes gene_type:complete